MKLLAELPTEDVEETHHRPVAAILGGIAVLVIMLGVGVTLVITSGSPDGESAAPDTRADTVELSEWTSWAAEVCETVAQEHPSLAETATADPAEVDHGVRALADSLRDLRLPTAQHERSQALAVITAGELAEQAWGGVNSSTRAEAAEGELARADNATQEFVDQLEAIGATCVR